MQYFNGKEDLFYSKLHKDGKSCLLIFKDGFKLEIIEKEKVFQQIEILAVLRFRQGDLKKLIELQKCS